MGAPPIEYVYVHVVLVLGHGDMGIHFIGRTPITMPTILSHSLGEFRAPLHVTPSLAKRMGLSMFSGAFSVFVCFVLAVGGGRSMKNQRTVVGFIISTGEGGPSVKHGLGPVPGLPWWRSEVRENGSLITRESPISRVSILSLIMNKKEKARPMN